MSKIVYAPAEFGLGSKNGGDYYSTREVLIGDPLGDIKKEIEEKQKNFKEHMEKRDLAFGEELVAVAMNPDRVGGIVEKYGVDAVEKTFG
jgi:hypothetical protein